MPVVEAFLGDISKNLMVEPEHFPPEATTRGRQGFLLVLIHPDPHLIQWGSIAKNKKSRNTT